VRRAVCVEAKRAVLVLVANSLHHTNNRYCDIYKRRLKVEIKPIYEAIEKRKATIFPKTFSVSYEDGTEEENLPLFRNYIELVEKSIDFENMIEAAGGEKNIDFHENVEFEHEEIEDMDIRRT